MKNNLLKFYIFALYFGATFVMFAQGPGSEDEGGGLEGVDPPAPIGDYVWLLFAIGVLFVFLKYRNNQITLLRKNK